MIHHTVIDLDWFYSETGWTQYKRLYVNFIIRYTKKDSWLIYFDPIIMYNWYKVPDTL